MTTPSSPQARPALSLYELRRLLDDMVWDTAPVIASYDCGCAHGNVVAVEEDQSDEGTAVVLVVE